MKLIQALEGSEVNVSEVERIITGDPALTAAVLRAASSALYGGMDGVTTVRGAIIRLGQQSVQAVAVSLGVQALMGKTGASSLFDRTRFARHSIFVGFLARYLFACRFNREAFKCKWSKDEILPPESSTNSDSDFSLVLSRKRTSPFSKRRSAIRKVSTPPSKRRTAGPCTPFLR